jgi:hypothetical protein
VIVAQRHRTIALKVSEKSKKKKKTLDFSLISISATVGLCQLAEAAVGFLADSESLLLCFCKTSESDLSFSFFFFFFFFSLVSCS